MTALTRYARLETVGRWHPAPGAIPREVTVSFGNSTLVLSDASGLPLTHWSLPAVTRLNPEAVPALFAPDQEGTETLEVEDDLMVSAIETVRLSVAAGRADPRRLRRGLALGVLAGALALAAIWAPGALRREALAVVPAAKRSEIGATMLGHLQSGLGAACRDPLGVDALERLGDRVMGEAAPGQIVVLPDGPASPLALPGGIVVLSRAMVEEASEPAVVAGHVVAARAAPGARDPLAALLDEAGPWATLRLLATGDLEADVLSRRAEALAAAPLQILDGAVLGPAFAAAEVPLAPYALALDPTGAGVADLLAADPYAGGTPPMLLADAEWVSLQGICGG